MTWGRRSVPVWPGAAAGLLLAATAVLGPAAASPAAASQAAAGQVTAALAAASQVSVSQGAADPAAALAAAPAACQPWAGAPLPSTQTGSLFGLAVVSSCDAWAVGAASEQVSGGTAEVTQIQHWNGAAWTTVPSPSPSPTGSLDQLNGVSAVSTDDVWAVGSFNTGVGDQTLVEHWDGTSWTQLPSPDPGSDFNELNAVHALSADDVWAVGNFSNGTGSQNLTLHWDGTAWSQAGGAGPGDLFGVGGTAGNDVWAVGTGILHWNGTGWTQVPTPNLGSGGELTSVAATSSSDAWAVGTSGGQTITLHWDGTSWTRVTSPDPGGNGGNTLSAVTAVAPDDAWAVGDFTAGGSNFAHRTLLLHWDGTAWTQISTANPGASNVLLAAATGPAGDLWTVGSEGDFSTGVFTPFVLHESAAAGGCHGYPGAPPPSPGATGNQLRGVATLSACDAWAVGSAFSPGGNDQPVIEHWDGASWTAQPSPGVAGVNNFLTGVSATSDADAWAVGFTENTSAVAQPLIEHWDGTAWTIVPGPAPAKLGSELNGVRALSPTNVWAVGSAATRTSSRTLILHWDGTSWTRVTSPSPGSSSGVLAGVAATSSTDVWAVGHFFGGMVRPLALHWDGTGWTRAPIAASVGGSLAAVSAVSASSAWAVGAQASGNGTLALRWNGHRWLAVSSPSPGVTSQLFGVAASSPSDAWAVGVATSQTADQTLILHWSGGVWSAVPDPGPDGGTLFAAAGTSAANVWAVGSLDGTTQNQNLGMNCC